MWLLLSVEMQVFLLGLWKMGLNISICVNQTKWDSIFTILYLAFDLEVKIKYLTFCYKFDCLYHWQDLVLIFFK